MTKKSIKWINSNIQEDLSGKSIIITGGNAGIGYEVASFCCYLKMHVYIAVRNRKRGEDAKNKLLEEFKEAQVDILDLDVSNEESIINFVNHIKENKIDIDYLYHNAGVYNMPYQILNNGTDLMLMTNYFGPFIIQSLLKDYLHSLNHPIKCLFTTSVASKWAKKMKLEDLTPQEKSKNMSRYAHSKLLDAFLGYYLANHDKNNVTYAIVHPGVSGTSLFSKAYKSKFFVKMVDGFMKIFGNPSWKSALSTIYLLQSKINHFEFVGPAHFFNASGYPKKNKFLKFDEQRVEEFINRTSEIIGYKL